MRDYRMLCGTDLRRTAPWPEDNARADGFVARYGGMLCAAPVGDAAVAVTWDAPDGSRQTVTGVTFQDALTVLQSRMAR